VKKLRRGIHRWRVSDEEKDTRNDKAKRKGRDSGSWTGEGGEGGIKKKKKESGKQQEAVSSAIHTDRFSKPTTIR